MSKIIQISGLKRQGESADSQPPALSPQPPPPDLEAMRRKLKAATGKKYWRSLEELAGTEEFNEFLHREFPQSASEWNDPVGRRKFLKLMGASLALAGLSACTVQPEEKIVPYVRQPEGVIPGKPLFFATAMPLSGVASGLLVESHEGRPTKIEGNPDHPINRGTAGVFEQASVLCLYDPDRSQTVTHLGDISTWTAFLGEFRAMLGGESATGGAGVRLLTGTITSPTLASQIREVRSLFPLMKWHQYEPGGRSSSLMGAQMAFGAPASPLYQFDKADVVLSLNADFLYSHPGNLRYIGDFIARRALRNGKKDMNRLYVVEHAPTSTGAKSDHRLALRASEMEAFARALAAAVGVQAGGGAPATAHGEWIAAVAKDLQAHKGSGIVIAGDEQSPAVHALAHAMNLALGNVGKTVNYIEPIEVNPVDHIQSIRELARDIEGGSVKAVVILGGNPVYDAPADLNFSELLRGVEFTAHLGLYSDETSAFCRWHIPEAHYLESWGDARAIDGTATIIQPLIAPLYGGKTAHEVLAAFTDRPERSSYDIVREFWSGHGIGTPLTAGSIAAPAAAPNGAQPQPGPAGPAAATRGASPSASPATPRPAGGTDFERLWRKALHDGVVPNTASPTRGVTISAGLASTQPAPQPPPDGQLELVFRLDPSLYDGQFANNGWLQELPKPVTKLTWDTAAFISPATARRLGAGQEDVIEVRHADRSLRLPVFLTPGHADDSITVTLGHGRERAGKVGNSVGVNAYPFRTSDAPWFVPGVEVVKTGDRYMLATTQHHWSMEGRDMVRGGTLQQYHQDPHYPRSKVHEPDPNLNIYGNWDYRDGYRWGMAIDLIACTGCNACIVACQSENNIAVVGKEEVSRGREMHWLRVDRYYKGDENDPEFYFMPVPCMHCETAPCEVVCPVAATVHSAEGTNDMVYNRCVGTRYCENNCPYKVRRFNFLLYQDFYTETYKMMRNPDVTVRSRGVMEKCTYCIQRIQYARIEAEKEDRRVGDGEVKTACQATCPADAIVFGDINDPESRVAKLKAEPRNYSLLADLNTRPRTTYLAAVKNPNHEIDPGEPYAEDESGRSTHGEVK